MSRRYGWKKGLSDQRDFKFAVHKKIDAASLPESVDLRPQCPPVYDQGDLGSCTANALAGAYQFDEIKEQKPGEWAPSRLFIYYNERLIEGTVNSDAGAEIRDGIKSLIQYGVCAESLWGYNIAKFKNKPNTTCYKRALPARISQYLSLDNTQPEQLKACLAGGLPFVLGFTVYESFESQAVADTGIMPMPAANESVLGGHAVLCVGYDNAKDWYIVRNSWGPDWGAQGYFYMPAAFLTSASFCSDLWCIEKVPLDAPALA